MMAEYNLLELNQEQSECNFGCQGNMNIVIQDQLFLFCFVIISNLRGILFFIFNIWNWNKQKL